MNPPVRSLYREFSVPIDVHDRLVCLWTQEISGGGDYIQQVMPGGCADIVWMGSSAPVLAGPTNCRVDVRVPGQTRVIGIRFRPGWAACSLGIAIDEVICQQAPLNELGTGAAAALSRVRLAGTDNLAGSYHAVGQIFDVFNGRPTLDPAVQMMAARLARPANSDIRALVQDTGLC